MDINYKENNKVFVTGIIVTEPLYSHTVYGENFYIFGLQIPRLSDEVDTINVTVSQRLLVNYTPMAGDRVTICGQYRSYNNFSDVGNKLMLTVFAKDMVKVDTNWHMQKSNNIYLNGFICKPPIYRTTPFQREIADILLAVNRSYNKSDYIPCIAWGRNAEFAENLTVGTNLSIWGRIQSREYQKRIGEDKIETKLAYEVSISKMEVM